MRNLLLATLVASTAITTPVFAQNLFAFKEVQPATIETLRAKEGGVMDSIEVAIGDDVTPNQILARLDHDKQLHSYNMAKLKADNRGALEIAEGDLMEKPPVCRKCAKRFRRRQVSQNQVQQSEGQTKSSKGKLEQAKLFSDLAKLEFLQAERGSRKTLFPRHHQGHRHRHRTG